MRLIPFAKGDGTPNSSAIFITTVLQNALYFNDREPFDIYAAMVGGTVKAFTSDFTTFVPDYGIITVEDEALVVMDGTVNAAQWAAHSASAFFPVEDSTTQVLTVASFYGGCVAVEGAIRDAIRTALRGTVQVSGHSYGGAAANIFATHLQYNEQVPERTEVLTNGEPYSYSNQGGLLTPTWHTRIVAGDDREFNLAAPIGCDPVPLTPPGLLQFFKLGLIVSVGAVLFALKWKHRSPAWELTNTRLIQTDWDKNFVAKGPVFAEIALVNCIPFYDEHFCGKSYGPKSMAAWERSGVDKGLSVFVPYALKYASSTPAIANNLLPPAPNQALNNAWSYPAGTVNSLNRLEWATISAESRVIPVERQVMPVAPVIPPTFKGTFFYTQDGQGASQSFYAVAGSNNVPSNFNGMANAMVELAKFRTKLSQGSDNPDCINPLQIIAIRIQDERSKRKGLLITNPPIQQVSYAAGTGKEIGQFTPDNDEYDVAYKVNFADAYGNTAMQYFHGVPLFSQVTTGGTAKARETAFSRFPDIRYDWTQNLYNFCNKLRSLGLGLRYATVQWTENGNPVGVAPDLIPGTGNGSPDVVEYNKAGFPPNTYSFKMPVIAAPVLGKFRVIIRGMKLLAVLNGRWPAYGKMIGSDYWVNVRRRAANYLPFDNNGYLSPEIWSVFQPDPAPPLSGGDLGGVTGIIMTEKKMGRPFDLQRGRQRTRPT